MAWFGSSIYECLDCNGDGESVCRCCGNEGDCADCEGSGLDPGCVDIKAYRAATDALTRKMIDAGCVVLTWAWIENGVWLGRDGGEHGRVAIEDHLTSDGHLQKKMMGSATANENNDAKGGE